MKNCKNWNKINKEEYLNEEDYFDIKYAEIEEQAYQETLRREYHTEKILLQKRRKRENNDNYYKRHEN